MDLTRVLVVLVVVGFALWLLPRAPLDQAMMQIIRGTVIIVVILWLLYVIIGPVVVPLHR